MPRISAAMRSLSRRCRLYAIIVAALAVAGVADAPAQTDPQARRVAADVTQLALPFDLSGLNHRPAGALGRVRAEGSRLVFGDGTPARFWGVNLQASALFSTPDDQIGRHARRLAQLGVNLVRLHHHDSPWVNPNIFGKRGQRDGRIDARAMDRIDRWVAALRAEGIYIWLDLHVGRIITPQDALEAAGQDALSNAQSNAQSNAGALLAEVAHGKHEGDLRGYTYVNPALKTMMQDFAARYLGHTNPYTGTTYAQDPAIMAVLISNENDLVSHFSHRLLPGKGTPLHASLYRESAQAFADQHGFDRNAVWQSWKPGPASLFLADLEYRFHRDMIGHLRALGYDGLIAPSSMWGGMQMSGLASLSVGDIIDVHSYGRDGDISKGVEDGPDMLAHIAAAQLVGRPLSVSEWNIGPAGAPDRLSQPLRVAGMAGFQGWDAMMLYGYAQRPLRDAPAFGRWHGATDPNLIATLPAAALLYRLGQVPLAQARHVFAPDAETLFGQVLGVGKRPDLRAAMTRARVETALPASPALPWMTPSPTSPEQKPVLAQGSPGTLPFRHIPAQGQFLVNTPHAQIMAGRLDTGSDLLGNLQVTGALRQGVVAVQSLTGDRIEAADQLLISVAAPAQLQRGQTPRHLAETLTGTIRFRSPNTLVLSDLSEALAKGALRHDRHGDHHVLVLENAVGPLWIVMEKQAP